MKRNIQKTVFLSLIILLGSCSTSKLFPVDTSNNAKNLHNIEGKAIVYVFRKSALGAAVGLRVDLNNIELAKFYPKKFYLCVLDPGKYVFTGHGENEDDIIVKVEGNKKYYIEVMPQMGWASARCKLELTDPFEGNEKVQKCKLIGLNKEAKQILNYSPVMK